MTKYQFDAATSRVVPLTDDNPQWGKHFGQADLVIEVGRCGCGDVVWWWCWGLLLMHRQTPNPT